MARAVILVLLAVAASDGGGSGVGAVEAGVGRTLAAHLRSAMCQQRSSVQHAIEDLAHGDTNEAHLAVKSVSGNLERHRKSTWILGG